MHGPEVVSWLLVSLCAASGAYCLASSWRGHSERHRIEQPALVAGLMGLGMAAMALPARLVTVPPLVFSIFFALLAGWALCDKRRSSLRHSLHHALEGSAMVYMALVLHPGPTEAGHTGAGHPHGTADPPPVPPVIQDSGGSPVITGALLSYLTFYAVRTGVRVPALAAGADGKARGSSTSRETRPDQGSPAPSAEPGLVEACHGSLALSCAVMLLVS